MASIVLFGSFALMVLLNTPIPFALGLSSVVTLLWRGGVTLMLVAQRMIPAIDSFALLSIPLFILAGDIMNTGGCGKRLVKFANALVGHIRGGLAHANILASLFFGGISGSASADTAALGAILIPAMTEEGYDKAFSTVVTITSSPLGTIIPPSIVMVLYGWMTGAPVPKLFAAGFIPGTIIGIGLMVLSYVISKKHGYGKTYPFRWSELWKTFIDSLPALLMPLIILGGIFGGVFTATEAAAVAVMYGLIAGFFIYKELKLKDIPGVLIRSCLTTGGVMLLIALSATFGWVMSFERIPLLLTEFFIKYVPTGFAFLMVVILISLIIGCFLTPTSAQIIMVPILYPVALRFGIDPIHFGLVLICALAIGHVTPPVGLCLYIGSSISQIPVAGLVRPLVPFILVMIITTILIALIPELVLFIPRVAF
ncbi:MAG: TRAP transporter large permease [Bacillota bacterium]|jgi:C4-dicarboxylate transporter DctM subunit|nr:TRAP transporter large permease [Bacillota bacterium]